MRVILNNPLVAWSEMKAIGQYPVAEQFAKTTDFEVVVCQDLCSLWKPAVSDRQRPPGSPGSGTARKS